MGRNAQGRLVGPAPPTLPDALPRWPRTRREQSRRERAVNDDDGHALVEILHDDVGVIVWCSCGRWGYAGPNQERARAAHRVHVAESRGDALGDG